MATARARASGRAAATFGRVKHGLSPATDRQSAPFPMSSSSGRGPGPGAPPPRGNLAMPGGRDRMQAMTGTARAAASRRNGARSQGPRTVAGKARSARNALRHGLRARRVLLLDGEDAAEFRAFATRLQVELMPEGALQESLVSRIVIAAWRSRRAARRSAPTSVVGRRSGATTGGRPWEPADGSPAPSRAGPARALCRARRRRRSGPAGGARRRPDPGRPRRPRAGDIAPLSRLGPRRTVPSARRPREAPGRRRPDRRAGAAVTAAAGTRVTGCRPQTKRTREKLSDQRVGARKGDPHRQRPALMRSGQVRKQQVLGSASGGADHDALDDNQRPGVRSKDRLGRAAVDEQIGAPDLGGARRGTRAQQAEQVGERAAVAR